jgi:hypothetical protein
LPARDERGKGHIRRLLEAPILIDANRPNPRR